MESLDWERRPELFGSALIGIAIQEGYIQSTEDPITDYISELVERDLRFKDIQIRLY
jgi:hypothetical protein